MKKNKNITQLITSTAFLVIASVFLILSILGTTVSVVEGSSMEPHIHDGQHSVRMKKSEYKHGDVVIAKNRIEKMLLIKRVIGIPGDKLEIKDDVVYINGKKQNETYIKEKMEYNDDISITLAKDQYWLMGDNRNNSGDSRLFGTFRTKDILGKVLFNF